MMKIIVSLLILICAAPVAMAQDNAPALSHMKISDDTALRGFIWGLPKKIIKQNEKGTFMEEAGETLFFLDNIRGLRTTIGYEFQDNKLWRAKVFIEKKYFEQQERLDDLMTVQADLNDRFGAPFIEDMKWLNEREKNYPESWGWAVFRGEMIMTSIWRNDKTQVTTYIGATEKFQTVLSVTYEHLPTKLSLEKIRREKLLNAL